MSATSPLRPVLPPDIRARKGSAPLVVLTAYTTPMARLVDAHCDVALVIGANTLVRLSLKGMAEQSADLEEFMTRWLPHYCEQASRLIEARAAFLHEESGFFASFGFSTDTSAGSFASMVSDAVSPSRRIVTVPSPRVSSAA